MPFKFKEIFSSVKDPRVNRTKKHPLLDIIALSICRIIAGCENFEEISYFGKAHIEWFNNFLELPHGIPSHDTFERVFAVLDNHALQWIDNSSLGLSIKHSLSYLLFYDQTLYGDEIISLSTALLLKNLS